jgi:SAM-dependent methyltransferase
MALVTVAQDAFGRALLDCYENKPLWPLVLEVDDGRSMPAMDPSWFFQAESEWVEWEAARLSEVVGPVLDLGAGAGRAALYLQNRGCDVTAIDHSPGAVDVCRRRGAHDARLADFVADLPTDRRWSSVLLLCGNFGLAGGWKATRRLLARLAESCAPEAVLLADTVDPTVALDERTRAYQARRVAAGEYIGDVTLRLVYGEIVGPWWRQTNFAAADVAPLVAGTGWYVEDHHVDGIDHYVKLRRN